MATSMKKVLIVADFDHTIINENSDISIKKLLPGGKVPENIRSLYTDKNWTVYMGEIFRCLHENSVTQADIKNHIEQMSFAPGMTDLISFMREKKSGLEGIIISDSNSTFIDWILKSKSAEVWDKVFTNPASFDESGRLKIDFYHSQDWCKLSTVNMCKGQIMEDYISDRKRNGVEFESVAYIGDGKNDLCPALRLGENDFVFVRKGYALEKSLTTSDSFDDGKAVKSVRAKVVYYDSGDEIVNCLNQSFY